MSWKRVDCYDAVMPISSLHRTTTTSAWPFFIALLVVLVLCQSFAFAHGIHGKDAAFVAASSDAQLIPFAYLGAKHMVTGYDHLLFLLGVIFFLFRLSQVALYVTLFSIGHSITLLLGVLANWHVDAHLVDAVIGLSVVYKAFDNLAGFKTLFGIQLNAKIAVFGFGLVHGLGLATKLQELSLSKQGLLSNLLAFNGGVELGQLLALTLMVLLINWWRRSASFNKQAEFANALIMLAGFVLIEYQLLGYFVSGTAS